MIEDKFCQKLKDSACQLKQLELYTSWSIAAEREVEELKKGISCKLLLSRAPKWSWDNCLELETYIRSNIVHDIYRSMHPCNKHGQLANGGSYNQLEMMEKFDWSEHTL